MALKRRLWRPRIPFSRLRRSTKETAQAGRPNPLYTVEAVSFEEMKNPAAQWVGEIADADGIDPRTIRSAGLIESMAQRIQAFNPDDISQAIDPNGEPLVVYQGGKVDFDRFDPLRTSNEGGLLFFTDSPQLASLYAEHGGLPRRAHTFVDPDDIWPQVKPVFLSIRHPLVADARGGTKDDIEGYYDLVDSVSYGRRVASRMKRLPLTD